jgi:hypothetical protein
MEESDRASQHKRSLTEELIKSIDERVDSPALRAQSIWDSIRVIHPEWTDWDLLCFAIEFLGMISPRWPWLTSNAKQLAGLVYHAHYFYPDNINARIGKVGDRHTRKHEGGKSASNGS